MRALFGILCILIIVSSTLFDVDIEVHCDAAVGKWCWSVKLIEADFLVDDIVARTHDHCIISNVSSVAFEREIAYDGWNTDIYEIEVVIEHNCTLYTEGPRLIKRDFGVFPIDRGNVSIVWKTELTDKGDKSPPKFWLKDTLNDALQLLPF